MQVAMLLLSHIIKTLHRSCIRSALYENYRIQKNDGSIEISEIAQ